VTESVDKEKMLAGLRQVFDGAVPFNRYLGMRLTEIDVGHAVIEIPFREEFIGDVPKKIVHGGVISALIDVAGGATAFTMLDFPREISLNTVDMRVDYIRMGRGESFRATGSVLRKGNRICVTRVEVHNDTGSLVAHGTATYSIFAGSRQEADAHTTAFVEDWRPPEQTPDSV